MPNDILSREVEFVVGDLTLRGVRYGNATGYPTFAFHGWLDNCASFDSIIPYLSKLDIVALDLSGHGRSDHRLHIGAYNIWLDVAEIMEVARQLNWDKFGLIGHSRGAMIAMLMAGTYPEKITRLAAIESLLPWVLEPREAPEQLAVSINDMLLARARKRNYYPSFENAVKARKKGMFELSYQESEQLARRGVLENENGFYWANDPKLRVPSEIRLTIEQVNAFMQRITIPIELFVASDGAVIRKLEALKVPERYPNVNVHKFKGEHHLHMSQQTKPIAEVINTCFTVDE